MISLTGASVRCFHCTATFDGLAARWCNCLVSDPTLLCPHCARCFCDQPSQFRRTFWNTAARPLLDRRAAELRTDFAPNNNLFRDEIIRPLVLVADDNRLILRLAFDSIKQRGYGVLAARDGEEAQDLFARYEPELVITDALLPKIDGRDLCRRIKTARPSTPVVVMSAVYTQQRHRTEAIDQYQADDFLLKPVSEQRLAEVLQTHVPRG